MEGAISIWLYISAASLGYLPAGAWFGAINPKGLARFHALIKTRCNLSRTSQGGDGHLHHVHGAETASTRAHG